MHQFPPFVSAGDIGCKRETLEVSVFKLTDIRREARAPQGASVEETAMWKFAAGVKRFLVSEDGPTAVEYAVMLALIVVVCITAVTSIGTAANTKFNAVSTSLQ